MRSVGIICDTCGWEGHRVPRTDDYDGLRYGRCPKCQSPVRLRHKMQERRRAVALGELPSLPDAE